MAQPEGTVQAVSLVGRDLGQPEASRKSGLLEQSKAGVDSATEI